MEFAKHYFRENIFFDFGEQIMDARLEKGLSQAELAEKAGTSQSAIARIENAQDNVTFKKAQRIAEAMDCTLKVTVLEIKQHVENEYKPVPHAVLFSPHKSDKLRVDFNQIQSKISARPFPLTYPSVNTKQKKAFA